jgi:hemin uptake protein HemP
LGVRGLQTVGSAGLRRATRCEKGSVRERAIWHGYRSNDQLIAGLASKLCELEDAEKQLGDSGTLAPETYAKMAPLVEEQKNIQSQQVIQGDSECRDGHYRHKNNLRNQSQEARLDAAFCVDDALSLKSHRIP